MCVWAGGDGGGEQHPLRNLGLDPFRAGQSLLAPLSDSSHWKFFIILSWDLFPLISTPQIPVLLSGKTQIQYIQLNPFLKKVCPFWNNQSPTLQPSSIVHYFQTSDCYSQDLVWFLIVPFKMWGWELSISLDVVVHYGIYDRIITSANDTIFLLIETKCIYFLDSCLYTFET